MNMKKKQKEMYNKGKERVLDEIYSELDSQFQEKVVEIYNLKLGEVVNEDMMNGTFKQPIKCVAWAVTLQDKHGTQMTSTLKDKDFIEDEEEIAK